MAKSLSKLIPILFLFLLRGVATDAQTGPARSVEISFEYLEGCETGVRPCPDFIVNRIHSGEAVELVFPTGGTQSNVNLLKLSGDLQDFSEENILRSAEGGGETSPIISLAGLPDGNYTLHMMSCAVGGSFTLILRSFR